MFANGATTDSSFVYNLMLSPCSESGAGAIAKYCLMNSFLPLLLEISLPITSAFAINKVQILFAFTFVWAASVDALVELIRTVVQVIIQTFVDIWLNKYSNQTKKLEKSNKQDNKEKL